MATINQINFYNTLKNERDLTGITLPHITDATSNADMSNIISLLVQAPKLGSVPLLPTGFYLYEGSVYRVQKSKSSHGHYAKRLIVADGRGVWSYSPGAMKNLHGAERLTVEQAAFMGHHLGVCVVCGATLTDEKSVAAGIGPVCAKKL